MKIPIDKIQVRPGRRMVQPETVKDLAQSMADIGMMNPITVDSGYYLVAGLHRLEAARLLGWTEVECSVLELDTLYAKLAEIDENLFRTTLTDLELGELIAERKKLYEAIHPERKRGGDRRSKATKPPNWRNDPEPSFAEDTARLLGVSPRTVERHIQITQRLLPDVRKILKGATVRITQQNLEKLSRLTHDQQAEVAGLLAQGKIRTVDQFFAPPEENTLFPSAALYTKAFGTAVLQLNQLIGALQKPMPTEYLKTLESQAEHTVTALNGFIAALNDQKGGQV